MTITLITTIQKWLIGLVTAVLLLSVSMVSYAETINYMYDEVNRLKRVETGSGTTAEYSYDGAGNRLQIQGPDLAPPVTTATPSGGIYNANQSVTLTCNDASGAGCNKIYYTTNGTTPMTASAVYSTPHQYQLHDDSQIFREG